MGGGHLHFKNNKQTNVPFGNQVPHVVVSQTNKLLSWIFSNWGSVNVMM